MQRQATNMVLVHFMLQSSELVMCEKIHLNLSLSIH